jgi:putative acetyltransferase
MFYIRPEQTGDEAGIYAVNTAAFHRADHVGPVPEAELVNQLRDQKALVLSMVAELDARIIGHALFSKGWIECGQQRVEALGLGPVAVLPECQRSGAGIQMIAASLDQLRQHSGYPAVFVLGHPSYYPRFGFKPSQAEFSIACEYDVPAEAFMALELSPGALNGLQGVFHYHPTFAGV